MSTTTELSLRVSVAALVRVIFEHPQNGELMLALERKATVLEEAGQQRASIRAQPFGGAIRILNLEPLRSLIGEFRFDSECSRVESDFRILIRPAAWEAVRQFCLQHLTDVDSPVLESDPARELVEEFADALATDLKPDQYWQEPVGIMVEDGPVPTDNLRAPGYATVRIYRIFEARIVDASLAQAMLENSERYSDQYLREIALADARNGGRGRANAVLALPLRLLTEAYLALSPDARAEPVSFNNHQLDRNVTAVLEGVAVPSYRNL
jgi:hypothetical protein